MSSTYPHRERLAELFQREQRRFQETHPASSLAHSSGKDSMLAGVPMIWMAKWPGGFPVYVKSASGARFIDLDDNEYTDFCLGDTGSMSGHSPKPTVLAISEQAEKGITLMLPTEQAAKNARELERRFGLPKWQFTLSATDANRHLIRFARHVTGRQKIAVHDYCYHGTVDETFANLAPDGSTTSRKNNIGAPVPLEQTTVSIPFNDLAAAEAAFATGEVAAMLMEPALTNIGIVLPDDGYLEGMQELCRKYEIIWILDETHTLSAGPGGMTAQLGLKPDALVLGKTIGGGIAVGAYGMTQTLAETIAASMELESIDVGGVGGTLAGNALSMAAVGATLTEVLTEKAFEHMESLAIMWQQGIQEIIDEFGLEWQVSRVGCRGEYSFRSTAPKTGAEAAAAEDFELQQFLQLHALNRGILMTPFHNMTLMSPETRQEDVERHLNHFREAVAELFGD
jgi:glutamate-1-semialdehyde 2,1-aminomutase